jgi:[ribosomal protein S5]-alanine N-acetyltransferase
MRLETERLILREFTIEDFDAFAWLMADPEVMRFSLNGPMNKEQAREYFQKRILAHYSQYGYGLYAVVLKENNALVGLIGLISQNIDGEDKVELGYRLHRQYWGKGMATEACLAVCHCAFTQLGINELISIIDPKNTRSLKVAKRVGMKYLKDISFHNIPVQIYMINASEACQNVTTRNLQAEDLNKNNQYFHISLESP